MQGKWNNFFRKSEALIMFCCGDDSVRVVTANSAVRTINLKFSKPQKTAMVDGEVLKVVVFVGSVRPQRMADRVVSFVLRHLRQLPQWTFQVIDPMEHTQLSTVQQPYQFQRPPRPNWMEECYSIIEQADAYIVISPEYNREISPHTATVLDNFPITAYQAKPCATVTYSLGPGAAAIAANKLRSLLIEIGMVPFRDQVNIAKVNELLNEDGTLTEAASHVSQHLDLCLQQLEWMANALRNYRLNNAPYSIAN